MSMVIEHSDTSILQSPIFLEEERNFLVECLQTQVAAFSLSSNCRLYTRILQHDKKVHTTGPPPEWVVLIHGYEKYSTSWTWVKFAIPFYKRGFNVMLVDLTGFGKSSIAGQVRQDPAKWRQHDAAIIAKCLAEFQVTRAKIVTLGEAAQIWNNMALKYRDALGKQNVLVNPVISKDTQADVFVKSLRAGLSGMIWVCFDPGFYASKEEYMRNYEDQDVSQAYAQYNF